MLFGAARAWPISSKASKFRHNRDEVTRCPFGEKKIKILLLVPHPTPI